MHCVKYNSVLNQIFNKKSDRLTVNYRQNSIFFDIKLDSSCIYLKNVAINDHVCIEVLNA